MRNLRVSYDGRSTVLRKHANTSRLSGEKTKRHSYECRVTLSRMSRDCRTNENENKLHSRESRETLSRMSDLVRNPEDRFSRVAAHFIPTSPTGILISINTNKEKRLQVVCFLMMLPNLIPYVCCCDILIILLSISTASEWHI